jgi:L-asparagine transporter-like permease
MCMLHHPHHAGEHHAAADHERVPWYKTRLGIALLVLLGVVAYFLWTDHRGHVIVFLPYALLLLCPLMHVFMHHGHGGHGDHRVKDEPKTDGEA